MAHGDVTVAFFDFLSENHDYIVFYSTEWPPYGQNPIFYGVFGGPSRREVHAPEGQNPRKVAFLKKKFEKQKKTQKSSKFGKIIIENVRAQGMRTGGSPGAPSRARTITLIDKSIS